MRAQGRDEVYIKDQIAAKLKRKGCLEDAKNFIFTVSQGPTIEPQRIFRCPRALALEHDISSHFSEYFRHRECGVVIDADKRPWKWHQIMSEARNEIMALERNIAKNHAQRH